MEVRIEETPLYQALKQYRYETSKAEGVKAYYIFNNAQMEALIAGMPRSLESSGRFLGLGRLSARNMGMR